MNFNKFIKIFNKLLIKPISEKKLVIKPFFGETLFIIYTSKVQGAPTKPIMSFFLNLHFFLN